MPSYTKNCVIYDLDIYVQYSVFMFWLTDNNIVAKGTLLFSLAIVVLNVCKGGYRIRFSDLDKKYRKEGKIGNQSDMKRTKTKK